MIFLILAICALLLFFILVGIFEIKGYFNENVFGIIAGTCLGLVFAFNTCIDASYNWKPDLERKHELEVLLVNDYNANTISKAEKYNKDVDIFNNYWCRFSIEDRSDYYIDIDSFLKNEVE